MQNEGGSGFSFVVPTEFVELPSRGRFYPEGHPLHGEESIEIRQMTAKEEDILTSRTLLKKGIALDRVVENLIVDKRIDPDTLLIGDKNAIVVVIRVSGYGNEYNTQVSCPACDTTQEYSFDLNKANIYPGELKEGWDITENGDGTFNIVLPRTKVAVTFRVLTARDEKELMKGMESDRKRTYEKGVTRQIVNIVTAVNGDSSPEAINYLVENIPSMDSRHLRLAYKSVAPNIDLTQHFVCEECDNEQDLEVPLTADFFWPDR
jgi:hypothetical protein